MFSFVDEGTYTSERIKDTLKICSSNTSMLLNVEALSASVFFYQFQCEICFLREHMTLAYFFFVESFLFAKFLVL